MFGRSHTVSYFHYESARNYFSTYKKNMENNVRSNKHATKSYYM